ncbi:MAG TPA: hypothetical protein VF278_02560 [Pirellulales bacterium]
MAVYGRPLDADLAALLLGSEGVCDSPGKLVVLGGEAGRTMPSEVFGRGAA